MKERMDELIDIINEADYNYHTLDNPTITDQEYDKYLRELIEIETSHPNWVREDSPTQHAGGKIIEGFEKVNHQIPMMSISDVFSESEIIAFDERIRKEGFHPEYVCELKIDGLSVSLLYEKGVDLKTISVLLGHKSIKTTERIYISINQTQKQNAVNVLDDI